jgi:hypothetical protein
MGGDFRPVVPRCAKDRIEDCIAQPACLSDWELGFCHSLKYRQRNLTAKQADCLRRICMLLGID